MTTGTLVLVHPVEEKGQRFLPLTYGYATTVRRAQGASLDMGCLFFDQKKRAAGRGYGYVAVSRFKSREGCFLYGKLRQTDFLPVGEDMESEILERGVLSESVIVTRRVLSLWVRPRIRIFLWTILILANEAR